MLRATLAQGTALSIPSLQSSEEKKEKSKIKSKLPIQRIAERQTRDTTAFPSAAALPGILGHQYTHAAEWGAQEQQYPWLSGSATVY